MSCRHTTEELYEFRELLCEEIDEYEKELRRRPVTVMGLTQAHSDARDELDRIETLLEARGETL